jgi:hypothetical protein
MNGLDRRLGTKGDAMDHLLGTEHGNEPIVSVS